MASGNMKDIKRRIKSVQSTMQITKAMELVASSKMRHAKERALGARPYFNALYQTTPGVYPGSVNAWGRPALAAEESSNANNIFGYSDPEMDALIDAAAMEADSAKRSELNAEIQQKVQDECVIVPIYQQEDIHCYTSDLQGFRNGAFQAPLLKYCYFA